MKKNISDLKSFLSYRFFQYFTKRHWTNMKREIIKKNEVNKKNSQNKKANKTLEVLRSIWIYCSFTRNFHSTWKNGRLGAA